MREAGIRRETAETAVELKLNLDGAGAAEVDTGVGFLDHMLTLLAFHARFDLRVRCKGDRCVDDHHSVEDVGIALGHALREAVGDRRGIARYGQWLLPMDEALVLCALDLSGRACLGFDMALPAAKVGAFDTELVKEFMLALTRESLLTLHLKQLSGGNTHHIIEAAFKALGRALRQAVATDPALGGGAASSKGTLL